jgi:hypothetical protein
MKARMVLDKGGEVQSCFAQAAGRKHISWEEYFRQLAAEG